MLDIIRECEGANRIGITGHTNPDGDCIGSTMAMWQFLRKAFPEKETEVLLETEPTAPFSFLKGVSEIVPMDEGAVLSAERQEKVYDVMIVLDTVIERCGRAKPFIESAAKVINIDHHVTNPGQGDLHLIDPKASATCEIVYTLSTLTPRHRAYMDKELAEALYIGIINDCGVFQYSNTTPETLRIAAELISYGFDFTDLIDKTFYERSRLQTKLTGMALSNAYYLLDGQVIAADISYEAIRELGAGKKDLGGIVSQLRYAEGVDVSIFLYGVSPEEYKVSLRSKEKVDVAAVCAAFGGGGHVRAAGCNRKGKAEEIIASLEREIAKQL